MGATDVPQAQAVTVSLQELVNGELINCKNSCRFRAVESWS